MAERKANFKDKYSHVWSNGKTKLHAFELNYDLSHSTADDLTHKLFMHKIICDAEEHRGQTHKVYYDVDGKMDKRPEIVTLYGVTNEDRIEEFGAILDHFEATRKDVAQHHHDIPPFMLKTHPIATGNREYIEFAEKATTKNEGDPTYEAPVSTTTNQEEEGSDDEGEKDGAKVQTEEKTTNNEE